MNDLAHRSDIPVGPRADATRAAIVATAERLFRSLGYRKTAVADIARELGMSPANVYRFFPSKSAINEAIASRILTGLAELCWTIARTDAPAADRIRTVFRTVHEQTLSLFFEDKRMHEMVEAALEEHWGVIDAHINEVRNALAHVVMDGQARGEFAPGDPLQIAGLLKAAMASFSHPTLIAQCAGEPLGEVAEGLANLLSRGMARGC